MQARYDRNKPLISEEEQKLIGSCAAAVVGLGGLGGTIAEQLARLGFGRLILIDGDVVDESNLNRQIFATEETIGLTKVEAALKRLRTVNSKTAYSVRNVRLDENNAVTLLRGADIVFDALDNISSRRILQAACKKLELPLVHGAIGGWCGQVSFLLPGDTAFDYLYPPDSGSAPQTQLGNLAPTASLVASMQVAQAVNWRLKKGELLTKRVLYIDLLTQEYNIIEL